MTEDRSEDVAVDVSELRSEGSGRPRDGGGGGGGGFEGLDRTAYGTDIGAADELGAGAGIGRFGSLGGSTGRWTYSAQSFDTEDRLGLTMDDVETFSNDSSRLTLSGSRLFSASRCSRSTGDVVTKFEAEPEVTMSVPPSDDRETE
jgi:hypothetical protein